MILEAASTEGTNFALAFVTSEWERVIDAWQLSTWEDYRDVRRIGRYRRLSEVQRELLWPVFKRVSAGLRERGLITNAELFGRLTAELTGGASPPYQYVVVDEAQDVSVPQLRFLAGPHRRTPERALLRWRPWATNLPAAVLMARTGHRRARPFTDPAHQLPHVAPDQDTGRPAVGP